MISAKQRSSSKFKQHLPDNKQAQHLPDNKQVLAALPETQQSALIPWRAIFIPVQNQILIIYYQPKKKTNI